MVTLKDVAAKAGVSPSTASGALRRLSYVRPETAERVLKAAQDLNYSTNVSARALRSGRTGILSLVIPTVDIPFYGRLVTAMEASVERHGYQLIIQQTRFEADRERQLIAQSDDTLSEGMFLLAAQTDSREVARLAGDHPTVMFEDYSTDIVIDSVNAPSTGGIDRAIRHLVGRGRTRICVAGATIPLHAMSEVSSSSRARYERARSAVNAFDELGISGDCGAIDCDWGANGGTDVGHRIADTATGRTNDGRPAGLRYDAVCCMNDDIALGVLRGLADRGVRVPEDVAVTGFDGIPQGEWSVPSLTTIALDYEGMAETAVAMMLRKFGDNPVSMPQRVIAGFRLIERGSTAVSQ